MKIIALVLLNLFALSALAQVDLPSDSENFVLRRGLTMSLEDQTADEEGLKLMWWNVGCSSSKDLENLTEAERASIDPENQWANLKELVGSKRLMPDVLILGEYCPSAFDQSTYDLIVKTYAYKYRLDKTNPLYKIRNGMRVFSKTKIRSVKEEVLSGEDFVNSDLAKTCIEDQIKNCEQDKKSDNCSSYVKKRNASLFNGKIWDRKKVSFTINHNRQDYKISPVHLANPWSKIRSCVGLLRTPREIKSGVDNPNYLQAEQLVEDFLDQDSVVLIGDFNAPKSIWGGPSNSYRLLSQNFGPSAVGSSQYTYSDPRRNFPDFSIDHAFVSSDIKVKKGVVLPFAGSDHLPIYVVLEQ